MIEVTNLSSDIDLESFRVSGLGTARLLVATCFLDQYPNIPISDPIRAMKAQLRELTDEKAAVEEEITILKGFGKAAVNMPNLTPDGANSFSDTLFGKTLSNAAAVRELDARITELGRQINKLGDAKTGATDARAVVTIAADEACPAQLRLTYRESPTRLTWNNASTCLFLGVDDAQWRPLYDLYAFSQDGRPSTSVSLHYRVNLSQGTGEDWNNARLVLSTSETDILNSGIPTSDSLVIEPKQPPPRPPSSRPLPGGMLKKSKRKVGVRTRSSRFRDVEAEVSAPSESDEDEVEGDGDMYCLDDMDVLPEMSEGGAVISKTPMAVNYTVDELTTIRSADESHKVLVAIIPFEATISHITTPRKSPLAYLQVRPPARLSLSSNLTSCDM